MNKDFTQEDFLAAEEKSLDFFFYYITIAFIIYMLFVTQKEREQALKLESSAHH